MSEETNVHMRAKIPLACALLFAARVVMAQSTVGELLDAGAKVLTIDEFRQELVQRVVVGPTPSGGSMELMYVSNGTIQGRGTASRVLTPLVSTGVVNGDWTVEGNDRICTTLVTGNTPGTATAMFGVTLPRRCQYWFRYAGNYYIADSDWDRSAKVLRRTVKQ